MIVPFLGFAWTLGWCFGCFRVCLVWGLVVFGLVPGCCSCGLVCLPEFSYWLWVGVIPVYAAVLGFGGFVVVVSRWGIA